MSSTIHTTVGKFHRAIRFNGGSISLGPSLPVMYSKRSVSFSFWMKKPEWGTISDDEPILGWVNSSPFVSLRFLAQQNLDRMQFVYRGTLPDSTEVQESIIVPNITGNQYRHIVGVVDRENNQIKAYDNGVLLGTANIDPNLFIPSLDSSCEIGHEYTKVYIDELAIYDKVLSDAEVQLLYQQGKDIVLPVLSVAALTRQTTIITGTSEIDVPVLSVAALTKQTTIITGTSEIDVPASNLFSTTQLNYVYSTDTELEISGIQASGKTKRTVFASAEITLPNVLLPSNAIRTVTGNIDISVPVTYQLTTVKRSVFAEGHIEYVPTTISVTVPYHTSTSNIVLKPLDFAGTGIRKDNSGSVLFLFPVSVSGTVSCTRKAQSNIVLPKYTFVSKTQHENLSAYQWYRVINIVQNPRSKNKRVMLEAISRPLQKKKDL